MTLSISGWLRHSALQDSHFAECRVLSIAMLNVFMLSVVTLNVIMLSAVMLNVAMLSVILLNVVALQKHRSLETILQIFFAINILTLLIS